MRIGYNTNIFGTQIITNEKLNITKGNNFSNADDYILYGPGDIYPNGIQIIFGANFGYYNRVTLDSIPTVLLHLQIELPSIQPV